MFNKPHKTLAAILCLAVISIGCSSNGTTADEDSTDEGVTSTAAADTTAPETTEPDDTDTPPEDPGTVVEMLAGNDDFSTLVAAVQAAGLVETLSGDGPFTVFAPTNDAFEEALTALGVTADELLADTDTLTPILTYHVLPGNVPAADVLTLDGQSVATVNGAEVTISVDGDTVMVNDATVIDTDIEASNGVIHVIDTVLVPPSA